MDVPKGGAGHALVDALLCRRDGGEDEVISGGLNVGREGLAVVALPADGGFGVAGVTVQGRGLVEVHAHHVAEVPAHSRFV